MTLQLKLYRPWHTLSKRQKLGVLITNTILSGLLAVATDLSFGLSLDQSLQQIELVLIFSILAGLLYRAVVKAKVKG